jgi:hypothetical protein
MMLMMMLRMMFFAKQSWQKKRTVQFGGIDRLPGYNNNPQHQQRLDGLVAAWQKKKNSAVHDRVDV